MIKADSSICIVCSLRLFEYGEACLNFMEQLCFLFSNSQCAHINENHPWAIESKTMFRFLEQKRLVLSTEQDLEDILIMVHPQTYSLDDEGKFCWCHLNKDCNE